MSLTHTPTRGRHAAAPERSERSPTAPRRRRWGRLATALATVAAAGAAAVVTVFVAALLEEPAAAPHGTPGDVAGPPQQTLLLVTRGDDGAGAQTVTLLAVGEEDAEGLVLFLPVGTLLDIPGIGLDRLGLARQYGDRALVHSAVESALGVRIDHVAEVTDAGLAAWLDRIGGLEVDVPTRLVRRLEDGSADVRFEAGTQRLDGARLAELWRFQQGGEDELPALARQQRILEGLFTAVADAEARAQLVDGGPPQLETDAEQPWLEELLAGLGEAREAERLRFSVLPVEPVGGDGPAATAFRAREADTRELVGSHLAGSMPVGGGADAVRIQVLNGVGVPGIGQDVDRLLDRGTFRIVRSDNAHSFDVEHTEIIMYAEDDRSLAAARRVQELLGVGTIRVSRQPQSVIDLSIVVGADFVDGEGSARTGPDSVDDEDRSG